MKELSQNKWVRAAIPALLLHCSIGTVYCWSIFSQEIADYIGFSKGATEWAFSFAIFFLGMSAAFLGNIVEKDIHKSSLIAAICFAAGMAGTGLFIWYGGAHPGSLVSLLGIYVCYGFIMGIGLGTGYLSPVKTLMLWFEDRKGLATGLAVAGFGAAKAIASPIMQALLDSLGEGGIYKMFLILAVVYFIMMFVGHLLLAKPAGWHEPASTEKGARAIDVIKSKPVTFIGIWIMFYLNITCGLALISQEKMIIKCLGLVGMVGVLSSVTAIFNAGGRLGFSAWADTFKDRNTIYKIKKYYLQDYFHSLHCCYRSCHCYKGYHQHGTEYFPDDPGTDSSVRSKCRIRWWFQQCSHSSFRSLRHEKHQCHPWNHSFRLGNCRSYRKPDGYLYC